MIAKSSSALHRRFVLKIGQFLPVLAIVLGVHLQSLSAQPAATTAEPAPPAAAPAAEVQPAEAAPPAVEVQPTEAPTAEPPSEVAPENAVADPIPVADVPAAAHQPGEVPAAADAHDAHAGHHGPSPINWIKFGKRDADGSPRPPFLFALVNFIILLTILGFVAVPKLKVFIAQRSTNLAKELDEAASLKNEAEAKLKEYEGRLARLDSDVAALAAEIRAEAEAEKSRVLAAAEANAKRAMEDAEKVIAGEMLRMRAHLEREAVNAAVEVATRVIRERMTDADRKALSERFIAELAQPVAGLSSEGSRKPSGPATSGRPA